MNAILLQSESNQDLELLLTLAKKLGMDAQKISPQQWEDHALATKIELGMEAATVGREEIMKALGK